ncbi:Cytochrome b561 [Achromobacter veterisilvae]|uniref:Cytochrome b561 n=1 Tax=Achromobacter veterisilvae TaxID=2069367 RepID=A0A446C7P5_9BURK|nr:cytochrome b [Achromobacter veterisilvae]SSW63907.1 Cytochrome b561 [Achromobacter veterisilvae]
MTTSSSAAAPAALAHYDRATIVFHWLTALLVVGLFALAEAWGFLPRGTPTRRLLQSLHISFGLLFAAVFVLRAAWRLSAGRRLPPATTGWFRIASTGAHGLLYALMAAQIVLGFLFRWAQGEPFAFFGLFDVPTLIAIDRERRHFIGGLHNTVAWTIVILALLHALAGLFHHYFLRDGVLRRMLSSR